MYNIKNMSESKVQHDSATPAHGQQVITAVAFIHRKVDGVDKVFLPKRAATKVFLPGLYEMPGGHTDFGEEIKESLHREIMEELGVHVSLGDCFTAFTYQNNVKRSHSIEVVYFAKFVDPLDKITTHPEDHSGFEWFSRADIIARKNEIIPPKDATSVNHNHGEDPEYEAILKGFDLLGGKGLALG